MKYKWLNKDNNPKLIIFFNGWGMDEDVVNECAVKALERGDSIGKFLPFVDEDDVNELAAKALERGYSIEKFLPFMDEDTVAQMALKCFEAKNKQ